MLQLRPATAKFKKKKNRILKPVHREEAADNVKEAEVPEHLRRVIPAAGE